MTGINRGGRGIGWTLGLNEQGATGRLTNQVVRLVGEEMTAFLADVPSIVRCLIWPDHHRGIVMRVDATAQDRVVRHARIATRLHRDTQPLESNILASWGKMHRPHQDDRAHEPIVPCCRIAVAAIRTAASASCAECRSDGGSFHSKRRPGIRRGNCGS